MREATIPQIDSTWRARDGRMFRVLGWRKRGTEPDDYVGVLMVALPPFYPRQRRETEMRASDFGPGKFMETITMSDIPTQIATRAEAARIADIQRN